MKISKPIYVKPVCFLTPRQTPRSLKLASPLVRGAKPGLPALIALGRAVDIEHAAFLRIGRRHGHPGDGVALGERVLRDRALPALDPEGPVHPGQHRLL